MRTKTSNSINLTQDQLSALIAEAVAKATGGSTPAKKSSGGFKMPKPSFVTFLVVSLSPWYANGDLRPNAKFRQKLDKMNAVYNPNVWGEGNWAFPIADESEGDAVMAFLEANKPE